MSSASPVVHDPEQAVHDRYAAASRAVEPALCCPVSYSGDYLAAIPQEIIDRDYGCGDPSPFVRPGETVLDLGSGGGKLCYILAQVVGRDGHVIGVDCNRDMLALARKHQATVAERIGYANVDFRYGMIQDLQLDLDRLDSRLRDQPTRSAHEWIAGRSIEDRLRAEHPLIASDSVDCVVSNCVLNLVRRRDREQMFREIFRVLKPGGRAAISDIVSDKAVPEELQQDGQLWSGCISGAYREEEFLEAFAAAGFHGMEIAKRQAEPWQTVAGIEFRSVTILAFKDGSNPAPGPDQTVIYKGPFSQTRDDEGHVYHRGARTRISERTFRRLQQPPYRDAFLFLATGGALSDQQAINADGPRSSSLQLDVISGANGCCDSDGCC